MLNVTVTILHNTVCIECDRVTTERAEYLTLHRADSTVTFPTKAVERIEAKTPQAKKSTSRS